MWYALVIDKKPSIINNLSQAICTVITISKKTKNQIWQRDPKIYMEQKGSRTSALFKYEGNHIW